MICYENYLGLMAIHITKSGLIEIIEGKFQDVQTSQVSENVGKDLKKISLLRSIIGDYFNFVMNLSQVLALRDTINQIDRMYPYISFIKLFLENTDYSKDDNGVFTSFSGFIFVDPLKRETWINDCCDLNELCNEAKRMIQYLHNQLIHKLKLMSTEDLNHIPRKYIDQKINHVDDKVFFDPEKNTLHYLGKSIHKFTVGKFPQIVLSTAFGDKASGHQIPLKDITERINIGDINDYLKNFKTNVRKIFKAHKVSKKLVDDFIIRKPDAIIEVSKIFQRI